MIQVPGLYKSEKTNSHWKTISIDNGKVKMIQMVESAMPVECAVSDFEKAIQEKQMKLNEGLTVLLQWGANVKPKRK